MHPTVNHLIQLQELCLVREEQRVAGGVPHLEQLNEAITSMTEQLPDDIRVMFEKLQKKNSNVIVPVSDSNCSACGMQLPRSLVQLVQLAKAVEACPNCARFLYTPAAVARNVRKRPGRFDVQKPGVSRFSAQSLMVVDLDDCDRDGAIATLAQRMEEEGFVDRADLLIEEALRREAIYSTAVDHGLAFPHVRGVEGGGLTLAVGLSKKGIHCDGPKGDLSHIIFFLVIPIAASAFYLKLLSGLTETFMVADAREALLASNDQAAMWKTLVKVTRKYVK
jgi:mannitol/fructose-specific phosphotransferase system IIA component (Ntr-type)